MDESYEWDDVKNAANRRKHGLDFSAVYDFDWDAAAYQDDLRFNYGEVRRIAYGRIDGRGIAIVFTFRGTRVRIISVRPARDKELAQYGL